MSYADNKKGVDHETISAIQHIVLSKFSENEKIIDLKLENLRNSIIIQINNSIKESNILLEEKLEKRISKILSEQKDKISWGMEVARFVIVLIMFMGSIKLLGV